MRLQPGDKLPYILVDGEVRIQRARPVLDRDGALKRPGQEPVVLQDMGEAIAAGAIDQAQ